MSELAKRLFFTRGPLAKGLLKLKQSKDQKTKQDTELHKVKLKTAVEKVNPEHFCITNKTKTLKTRWKLWEQRTSLSCWSFIHLFFSLLTLNHFASLILSLTRTFPCFWISSVALPTVTDVWQWTWSHVSSLRVSRFSVCTSHLKLFVSFLLAVSAYFTTFIKLLKLNVFMSAVKKKKKRQQLENLKHIPFWEFTEVLRLFSGSPTAAKLFSRRCLIFSSWCKAKQQTVPFSTRSWLPTANMSPTYVREMNYDSHLANQPQQSRLVSPFISQPDRRRLKPESVWVWIHNQSCRWGSGFLPR